MSGREMTEGNVRGGNNRTSLLQERFLVVDECALVARQCTALRACLKISPSGCYVFAR